MNDDGVDFQDHIVIIGWDVFSRMITQRLRASDQRVAIITEKEENLSAIEEEFPEPEVQAIHRNLTSYASFTAVNIEDSLRVFVNLPADEESLVAILNLKKEYDGLDFVVVLSNDELEQTFVTAGVSYVVSAESIASKIVTSYLYEPDVATYEVDLLAGTEEDGDHDVQQYRIKSDCQFAGQDFRDVFWAVKNEVNCLVIGLAKETADGFDLIKLPEDRVTVEAGDYLILLVKGAREQELQEIFGVNEGIHDSDV